MLKDLRLDYTNKKIINEFIKGNELVVQSVILSLQCWLGDWYLDGDFGTPYDERTNNKSMLLADIEEVILSNDGVSSVQNLTIDVVKDDKIFNFKINGNIILKNKELVELNGLIPAIGV